MGVAAPEISLSMIRMEDWWGDFVAGHEIGDDKWQKITAMARLVYGEEMAVSGVSTETMERYFLMASANEKTLLSLGQNEMKGRVIETQGKIIWACVERARELPTENPRYLALQQMARDLFENDLFTVFVPINDDRYAVISPISGRRKPNGQEEWARMNIGGQDHITPCSCSKVNIIGRTCFSPMVVGVTGAERRTQMSLSGKSAEKVADRKRGQEVGVRIQYTVYEPERLPDCWIEARTRTDERGSPVEFSIAF